MTPADGCRMRLSAQSLLRPAAGSAADLVQSLVAVQAQDYAGAKWALGRRLKGVVDADVEREVAAGRILRTHVLRPTWHFVTPRDIRWMLALTGPRVAAIMASYNRTLELTAPVFRRSNDAIARALEGGRELTRAELRELLNHRGIVTAEQRLARLVMQAELDAIVCSGARRGKEFTYALLDERVPPSPPRDRDDALGELGMRYFATRGPASPHDFSWWSGLSVADAKRAIAVAGARLERVEVQGRALWRAPGVATVRSRSAVAHLLPNYDEYFIGLRDRSAMAQRMKSVSLVTGGDARVPHVALVDGQLVGGWKRVVTPGKVVADIHLATRVSAEERRLLTIEAERLGRFMELSAGVRFTSPVHRQRRMS